MDSAGHPCYRIRHGYITEVMIMPHFRRHNMILVILTVLLSSWNSVLAQSQSRDEFIQEQTQATEQFQAWQASMFETRQAIAREQLSRFYKNMKVPPPLSPSNPATGASSTTEDEADRIRIDVPIPLPGSSQLSLSAGAPSASFQVGVEGKALSFIGASYTAGVSYSAKDNTWLVGDAADFKLGMDTGPAEITGTYQYHAAHWKQSTSQSKGTGGVDISADLYLVKGSLGYNSNQELSVGVGYDFVKTPKALSFLAEASIGVQAQVSAPVKVKGVTQGKRTLSGTLANQVARMVKLLTDPTPCPHCDAQGQLDCSTCNNTRTVLCTQCNGQLEFDCKKCWGEGTLTCPTCDGSTSVPCRNCDGTGHLKCTYCRGSGQVTTYETETRWHEVRKLLNVGFNANGEPFEEWGTVTEPYTVQVPKTQACSSCSGTGDGGQCGQCNGSGQVLCHTCKGSSLVYCTKCNGTGKIKCRKCRGSGTITCPDCRGKAIRCPLCKGTQQLGK